MQIFCDMRQVAQPYCSSIFSYLTWGKGLSHDNYVQSLYRRPHIASRYRELTPELGRRGPKGEPTLAANLGQPHKNAKLSLSHFAESTEAQITLVRNCQADLLSHFNQLLFSAALCSSSVLRIKSCYFSSCLFCAYS